MGDPIRLEAAARYTERPVLPHQLAAWNWLQEQLTREQLAQFAEMYRAAPKLKPEPSPCPGVKPGFVRLDVPYEAQNDNASGQGWRECMSSSCAMIAKYYGKVKNDDEYNRIRARYGDTTVHTSQIRALEQLGLKARFTSSATVADLERELIDARPVAVGWLHHGPVQHPGGGGHWSVATGFTDEAILMNDPNGEADLIRGGYLNHRAAKGIAYSRKSWLPRWLPDGPRNGWAIFVSR